MTNERDPIIVLDHISKSFTSKPVLQDVSLTVAPGEALCILGRSGTGKSVTLKLMIALLLPDSGLIRIAGENITKLDGEQLSHVRRKMGFLFQSAALFDSLTVYDNLAFPLRRLTSKSKKEIDESIDFVLNEVGLISDKNKMPVELSGGMKKRAGLARALVLEPEILLVDDDRPLREMLTRSFEREGHRVTAVPDGDTALSAASERAFDVVLLDVALGAGPRSLTMAA